MEIAAIRATPICKRFMDIATTRKRGRMETISRQVCVTSIRILRSGVMRNHHAPFWNSGRRSDPCATRRVLCMVVKHLSPVRGRQAYPPSLEAEQPPGEGSPGETMGSTGVVAHP